MKNPFSNNFRFMQRWSLICLLLIYSFWHTDAALAADTDDTSYVWALQGVNLREAPSPTAHVIKKLNYGTPVTILAENGEAVPYEMAFFPKIGTATVDPNTQPVLKGTWIKVKANDQQGYVFNKLLLTYPPYKRDEWVGDYLIKAFGLTPEATAKKKGKSDDAGEMSYTSNDGRKVRMTSDLNKNAEEGSSAGEIFIPGMSFDDAFVFFNAIFPPRLDLGYTYRNASRFEYQGGAEAEILTAEKGGVRFHWEFYP